MEGFQFNYHAGVSWPTSVSVKVLGVDLRGLPELF